MIGEQVADDTVWVTKTHEAAFRMNCLNFTANKIIICVRNPFDVLLSMVNFHSTLSHSKELDYKPEEEQPEWFDMFIRGQVESMVNFQEDVLKKVKSR